jgi:hypothetical protein
MENFFKTENQFNMFSNFLDNNIFELNNDQDCVKQQLTTKNPKKTRIMKKISIEKKSKNSDDESGVKNNFNMLLRKKRSIDKNFQNDNYISKNLDNLDFKNNSKRKSSMSKDSYNSDSSDIKKTIFKTLKGEGESPEDMRRMMRLMKNRLSARKCRQKKKNYMDDLHKKMEDTQNELDFYKKLVSKEKHIESMMSGVINNLFFNTLPFNRWRIKKKKFIIPPAHRKRN